jgi:hypothetical protein
MVALKHIKRSTQIILQATERSESLCAPDSVYSNNHHTIDDLKMTITE